MKKFKGMSILGALALSPFAALGIVVLASVICGKA